MLESRKNISRLDYAYLLSVVILILLGLAAIYSASYQAESTALKMNFAKQILWFILGLCALVVVIIIPMKFYHLFSYGVYIITIGMLVLSLLMGVGKGTNRWLLMGPMQFQPSEFAKIGVIMALARYLSKERRDLHRTKDIGTAFAIVLLPFVLVVKQPDLGTALVFAAMSLPILYWAGLPNFTIFVIVAPFFSLISAFNYHTFFLTMLLITLGLILSRKGLRMFLVNFILNVCVGILTPVLWGHLRDYQQRRILTFLGLEMDPHGFSYQVIQSKVAVGSGGWLGKGLLKGTQTQLRFLPEQHTDFVFSVIGEELGFLGVLFTLSLFLFLLLRGVYVASVVKNTYASLLVMGVVVTLAFHVMVNVGMTVGIMPVTGIPLPFLSYGGSSLITSLIMVGFIINASIRRYQYY